MRKLEDIPKKDIFGTPEGYFEKLPSTIQARVSEKNSSLSESPFYRFKLQYVLPVVLLLAAAVYWFESPSESNNVDELLASVKTEELIAYLSESDMTTEDLIDHLSSEGMTTDIDTEDADEQLLDSIELENVFDDTDLENI
jgi:hypothetical protein